ncbi:MAG: DNA primase [gamma proteobacterium symbiont of Stewartia floridana]|nr:MAG: DNA primase [gamma proteobacterium symbiont of Stewartia floridana]
MSEYFNQFESAMRETGIEPPENLIADGELHRFSSNGKPTDSAGYYILHGDGIPAGHFGCWRTGISQDWRADTGQAFSAEEKREYAQRMEMIREKRAAEDQKRKAQARQTAEEKWTNAKPETGIHKYLSNKGISGHGLRSDGFNLLVPLRDENGTLHSIQSIDPNGSKKFLSGGRVKGCYYPIGKPNGALCIAEGFATGASIHEATGQAVAVAFNSGNLKPVAEALRKKLPNIKLLLCADDDVNTEGNPGITKATEAAKAVGGVVVVPDFGDSRPEGATDFNDLHQINGLESVKASFEVAQLSTEDGLTALDDWPEPQPLIAQFDPQPYPLDALPEPIRAAVSEVQSFTKAPIPLVASSALAAISLATQAQVDVMRAEQLTGPSGLFLLTIADSGERKSTADNFFMKPIKEYEAEQHELFKPLQKDHKAAHAAWKAKRDGIKEKIRQLTKQEKPTRNQELNLQDLEHNEPVAPKQPRLIYSDATPEALRWSLATGWPSGGVVSSEAGLVFGSHGMSKDSVMRNLATLNILWDGADIVTERRSSESFKVRGARLSIALQVQETTLRAFFEKSGGLARGTGFLARFLVAWPESTQGYRPFTEAPAAWPALAKFNHRISAILGQEVLFDEAGGLTPAVYSMAPDAKQAWVSFHDAIESELRSGGELYDVRDVASKIADNAARIAALFQFFEHGASGAISLDAFKRASIIAAWHLTEARRFFGELALPNEQSDVIRLDSWLVDYSRRENTNIIPRREIQRNITPHHLRQKLTLDIALNDLVEFGRVRLVQDGQKKEIHLNPAIQRSVQSET